MGDTVQVEVFPQGDGVVGVPVCFDLSCGYR